MHLKKLDLVCDSRVVNAFLHLPDHPRALLVRVGEEGHLWEDAESTAERLDRAGIGVLRFTVPAENHGLRDTDDLARLVIGLLRSARSMPELAHLPFGLLVPESFSALAARVAADPLADVRAWLAAPSLEHDSTIRRDVETLDQMLFVLAAPPPLPSSHLRFQDTQEAAMLLAGALAPHVGRDAVVLGVPSPGALIGRLVASHLDLPFDVLVVRHLRHPRARARSFGTIAPCGVLVPPIGTPVVSQAEAADELDRQHRLLDAEEKAWRHGRPPLALVDKEVVLVDAAIEHDERMRAAVACAWARGASRVVVAAPIASRAAARRLAVSASEVITVRSCARLSSIARAYFRLARVTPDNLTAGV
jgi:predicted phosphoribosyltransferase